MNRFQTGFAQIAFETGNADFVSTRPGKINPANGKTLVVMRRILLILNVFTIFNTNPPDETPFTRIGEIYDVVSRHKNVDRPGRFAFRRPFMDTANVFPFSVRAALSGIEPSPRGPMLSM